MSELSHVSNTGRALYAKNLSITTGGAILAYSEATTSQGGAFSGTTLVTTGSGMYLNTGNLTSGQAMDITIGSSAFTGDGLRVSSTVGNVNNTGNLATFKNGGAASFCTCLFLDQDGNGIALDIDSEEQIGSTINVDAGTTIGIVLDINAPSLAGASGGSFLTLTDTADRLTFYGGGRVLWGDAVYHEYDDAPAADHTWSGGMTADVTAGGTVDIFSAVELNSDGKWDMADADAEAQASQGIALESAVLDGTFLVGLPHGIWVRDDTWAWTTIGDWLYLSTTAGDYTQTKPSATNDIVQICGFAWTADISYIFTHSAYVVVA